MEDHDLASLAREFRSKLEEVGGQFKEAFEKVSDDVQYRVDKELGKAMSRHPELYAELRKTYRQVKRGFEKAGKDLGLR